MRQIRPLWMVGKCHKLPEPEFLHLYSEAVKTDPFVSSCSTEQIIYWLEKMPDSEEPSKGHACIIIAGICWGRQSG